MDDHGIPKLLAIDDEPKSLGLIRDALSDSGLEILTASDVAEGWTRLKKIRPRIVLLDLRMPGAGLGVLESILGIDPGTEVILMTSHYSAEAAIEAIQKGACDYFSKPLNARKASPPDCPADVGGRGTAQDLPSGPGTRPRLSVRGNRGAQPGDVGRVCQDTPGGSALWNRSGHRRYRDRQRIGRARFTST